MEHYPFWKEKDHVFADVDGRVALVDTGAWLSISDRPEEMGVKTTSRYNGASVKDLRELTGVRFDFLMGLSAMMRAPVEMDLDVGRLTFGPFRRRDPGHELGMIGGFIPVTLPKGQRRLAIFDSGAQLSYLHKLYAPEWMPARKYRDFYPGHGEMEVEGGVAAIGIGDAAVPLNIAILPEALASMTDWLRAMILGNELLEHFSVRLDYDEQQMTLYDRIPRLLRKNAE
jgi:hypothetical protein